MPAANTPVTLGTTREMFFAALGQSAPQFSFLESQEGTTVTSAQVAREIRLGDPINTGQNSTWHQLTWQGGSQQDIWADNQMYQKGNVDVLTWTGKMKMWPGLQSWWKKDNLPKARGMAMWQGSRSNLDPSLQALTCGERDQKPSEAVAAVYQLFQLHPGYSRGDPRAIQHIATSLTGPWRVVQPAMADDYTTGVTMCMTQTQMFLLLEAPTANNVNDNKLVQDTNAPVTGTQGYTYHNDTACSYVDGFYYGHGNRFFKRVPKPPYGVLGTHTMVHAIKAASYLQGMCVWNNRIWFGAVYPNGTYSVFQSDGATTVKAFDMPNQFIPGKMAVVAGGLYIIGEQPSGVGVPATIGRPNVVQQLWRFDGVSLKKMWQEGRFEDGAQHFSSDIIEWNGMAVWAAQGTPSSGNNTGNAREDYACLMFYDPINDAIVPGPGLGVSGSNTSGHLWITGLARWNSTIAIYFRNDTAPGSGMIATLRPEDLTRNDFRWPVNGSDPQFQDPAGSTRFLRLYTSEYHGPDDVINEKKIWLSCRVRSKFTGSNNNASINVFYRTGIDSLSDTSIGSISPAGTGDWQDNVLLFKVSNNYLTSKKLQLRFDLNNNDVNQPDSNVQVWIDDVSVNYYLNPVKQRQFQVRIPISEAQLTMHSSNTPNSLTTSNAMITQLQSYFFTSQPVLWWPPRADGVLPGDTTGAIEVRITGYQEHMARLENSTDPAGSPSGIFGYITLTMIENEPAV